MVIFISNNIITHKWFFVFLISKEDSGFLFWKIHYFSSNHDLIFFSEAMIKLKKERLCYPYIYLFWTLDPVIQDMITLITI